MSLLIGTSGWSYKDWVGPFYPSKKNMFTHYSKYFHTAEINSTFYSYPSPGLVRGLARAAPPGFVFSAKVPKVVTHEKWLRVGEGVLDDLERFVGLMRPLAEHLGPFLIQLRPLFRFEEHVGVLEEFLEALPGEYEWAVEFRDPSWHREEVFRLLERCGVAYVVVDEPLLGVETRVTADFSYVRWHGRGSRLWYDYEYTKEELEAWVPRLGELRSSSKRVYGYFNNHFNANAVKNAVEMLELVGEASEPQLEALGKIEAFREGAASGPGVRPIWDFQGSGGVGVGEALARLTDLGRMRRGELIGEEGVRVQRVGDGVWRGEVGGYDILVDGAGRVLRHRCGDWEKGWRARRLCKHLVRFFLSMPEDDAVELLLDLYERGEEWTLNP